jgi:hypothetical protein
MSWIVGIICIILVIIFWRIFVPIGVLGALALGTFLVYDNHQSNKRERERERAEQSLRDRLAAASTDAGNDGRHWLIEWARDPASGDHIPRSASILSDGSICTLQVEQRINGTRLAGVYCPGFKINRYHNIEVKFDNRTNSDSMALETFSGSEDVYIPSYQPAYRNHLQYDEFLRRMAGGKKVALYVKFDVAGHHWVTFSLAGAGPALIAIGALQPVPVKPPDRSSPKGAARDKGAQSKATGSDPASQRRSDISESTSGLPANAELDYTGNNWKCKRGYSRVGNECHAVQLPRYAELDYTGNNWKCQRGYSRAGNECIAVQLPMHAELDYTGSNWKCLRGYRRVGSECSAVSVPAHGELDYTGSNWKCQRGYVRSGSECLVINVPLNGELDYTGNSWKCQRGFRRMGAECLPVGVASAN